MLNPVVLGTPPPKLGEDPKVALLLLPKLLLVVVVLELLLLLGENPPKLGLEPKVGLLEGVDDEEEGPLYEDVDGLPPP